MVGHGRMGAWTGVVVVDIVAARSLWRASINQVDEGGEMKAEHAAPAVRHVLCPLDAVPRAVRSRTSMRCGRMSKRVGSPWRYRSLRLLRCCPYAMYRACLLLGAACALPLCLYAAPRCAALRRCGSGLLTVDAGL